MLWPLHGSAGLHLGHGSCFSYTPFSGYPYASIPRRLAGPVFLSGVSPRGSSDCPPTLSRIGDCHPSQEVQPHTFPGSAVSVGRHRFHLFQGFSVGGTHLTAAIHSRRISVMRLAYREPVAVAFRRSFLAGSPRSWRLTGDAVPPALPPSFLVPSGSGGSSVSVDDVSSRSPVLAPSRLSLGVSLRQMSPDLHFWSDASEVGWGTHLDYQVASGLWDPQQTALSINARVLLAVQLGLFQLRSALRGRTVAVFCVNTTALTYLVSPAFEPLSQASFRALTLTTLFLLALATAKKSWGATGSLFHSHLCGWGCLPFLHPAVCRQVGVAHPFHPSLLLGEVLSRLCGWS